MNKPKMPYNVYIPTIGYSIGKATTNLNKIIQYCIEERRQAHHSPEMQEYYNRVLTDAYNAKYADLDKTPA
jgi:hypothetical protein